MAYQVRLTRRARRDLERNYQHIEAEVSAQALRWFTGLEAAIYSLERHPNRAPVTPEDRNLRHLLYGRKPHLYRVIYEVDGRNHVVNVLHIRHGARKTLPRQ